MHPTVVALLVSHDGARWLPAVLDGLRAQTGPGRPASSRSTPAAATRAPTCSRDAFDEVVTRRPAATAYPEAVRTGLEQVPADRRRRAEWVWLLHDDSNPAPDALERLLAAAADDPDGRRPRPEAARVALAASGCSRSASRSPAPAGARPGSSAASTTRASTTRSATVLAVNTAGMLVRRRVLEELGGFDDQLPIFGNDIDFGWRAAPRRAPDAWWCREAVVFHAEAAHRGAPAYAADRPAHALPGAPRRALHAARQRPGRARCPGRWSGSFFGTLLRMVGFLAGPLAGRGARRPGRAVLGLLQPRRDPSRPAARGSAAGGDARPRAPLLAPWWLPYRHGLDFVGDIVAAATNQAQDVADRRRAAKEAAAPVADPRVPPSSTRTTLERGHRAGRAVLHQPARGRAGARRGALACSAPARRSAASPAAASRRRRTAPPQLLAALDRVVAPAGHRAPPSPLRRTSLPLGAAGLAARQQRGRRRLGASCCSPCRSALWGAWRLLRVVGRLVDPGGSPRWLVALGAVTYALVPVTSRRLGRRPPRRRRRGRDPAVAGPRRARLRRPRARPPLARGLAHRAAARPGRGVRAGRLGLRGRARRRRPRAGLRRHAQPPARPGGPGARPLVTLGVAPVLLLAVVAARDPARRRRRCC